LAKLISSENEKDLRLAQHHSQMFLKQGIRKLGSPRAVWAAAIGVTSLSLFLLFFWSPYRSKGGPQKRGAHEPGVISVELTPTQAATIPVDRVASRDFVRERSSLGNIDFNQNKLVAVFAPYQGRILSVSLNAGDAVEKDQPLYVVDSPDLLTAEANVISAAGALVLQNRNLSRLKSLLKIGGASQQQVDQAVSDQQAAEGALKSARDVLRIFGKTQDEIDKIIADRIADSRFVVRSPLSGFVTARAAVPGQLVQPGVAPAPFVVADTSTMWMVANVVESDAPELRLGQVAKARIAALPGREFDGRITVLGPSIEAATRRQSVRIEVDNPDRLLRAGMFADFRIRVGEPFSASAVRETAVVREGDGTMVCWTTIDRKRFFRQIVQTGERRDGFVQIESGLKPGELVAGEGAVFLSNQAAIEGVR
jgi:cobalt-zinc-cadmium efflux system membrane fusion protein